MPGDHYRSGPFSADRNTQSADPRGSVQILHRTGAKSAGSDRARFITVRNPFRKIVVLETCVGIDFLHFKRHCEWMSFKMRSEKFACGVEHGFTCGPPDLDAATMADPRADMYERIVRMRIGNPVGIARTCAGAQALEREDAGLERGLVNRDDKSVYINLGSEIRGVFNNEVRHGIPL